MIIAVAEFDSPIGLINIAVCDGRLCALGFADRWRWRLDVLSRRWEPIEVRAGSDPAGVVGRLRAYFAGDVPVLDSIEVDPAGTPFQQRVWRALRLIPPGRTVSYGELARSIGAPAAVRAVGAANGANPIGIVIPCHRVIGVDGRLVGYGGGLERKRWLLQHEHANAGGMPDLFTTPRSASLAGRADE